MQHLAVSNGSRAIIPAHLARSGMSVRARLDVHVKAVAIAATPQPHTRAQRVDGRDLVAPPIAQILALASRQFKALRVS